MGIEYGILGPLILRIDGDEVPLGTEKENKVLAMLILAADEVVSRERLIDQLWGEEPPATAVNTLQTYVSRLRKTLHRAGREVLLTRRPGYLLVVDEEAIDADRFERLVVAGREALSSGRPEQALDLLDEALHLWRGPPLSDFAYQDFAAADISHLEELHLMAIETRLNAELELGRHHDVIPRLEALVRDHPLREGLSATLMLALYRDGRQGDALRVFQRVREVLAEELGIEPTQQLQELEEQMLLQDPQLMAGQAVVPGTGGNLPANLTPVIGREDDLRSLEELAETARLLTLIGEGGVGKSRLAVELGRRLLPRFEDGVWLAELSGLEDPDHVLATVGSVWRAAESDATGFEVIEFLRHRNLVLILDNCEAIVDGVAVLAERILQQAADVTIVATSREPLGCRGEVLWRVRPLEVPPPTSTDGDDCDVSTYGSVILFADRAAEVAPGFSLDEDSAPRVAQVVSMVDGLPLAIELAAAQMRRTALPELVLELDTHRELFVAKAPTVPPRHRALQHTLDWSYGLLDPEERELFGRLGVLILEFPIEAAEIVCGGAGIEERDVPRLLQGLVDKSLVVADSRSGRTRFRLLDTVQTYAFDKIAQGYAIQHERGFMTGLAQRTDPALRGTTEQMWAWLLGGDREVIRATLAAAAASFAEDQVGFLAGALAVLLTRTRRVAFLGGIDPDSTAAIEETAVVELMQRFRDGFRAGIQHVDSEVELLEEYMTDRLDFTAAFRDPLRARELASGLYGSEVDVVFHAAGSVGRQVFGQARRASEDTGVHRWAIGVDHDEYLTVEAELKPYVASSAIKQIPGEPYRDLKRAIAAGAPVDTPMFHLANQGVALATSGGHIEPYLGTLAELRSQVIAGELQTGA